MTLPKKDCGETVNLSYKNGMNAAEALHVYGRNYLRKRDPCIPQGLLVTVKNTEIQVTPVVHRDPYDQLLLRT